MKDLQMIYDSMQKVQRMEEFRKELKENPLEISKFKNAILNNPDIGQKEQARMISQMDDFKKAGLLKDDVPLTYDQFKSQVPEGHYAMKLSVYKQLTAEQLRVAHSVRLSFYDDLGCGMTGKVRHYADEYGLKKSHGQNNDPAGSSMTRLNLKNQDDINTWNNAVDYYDKAMASWKLTKGTILKERGKTLKEWHPLPDEYKEMA